jgi:hypothetical protein
MADKRQSSRKKPVSQKRVAMVLASLVGTLTLSAGMLLLMEGGALGTSPLGAAVDVSAMVSPRVPLREGVWKYIIIYESGDLAGSAASLADGRVIGGSELSQNMRPKVNFHFVIDNSRSRRGAVDGELETGTTWMNQESGAPYAGWRDLRPYSAIPYYNSSINGSIGVCLIGDSNREPISEPQDRKLIQLVQNLRNTLNMPDDCVRFQWELVGKATPAEQAFADKFRKDAGIKDPVEQEIGL